MAPPPTVFFINFDTGKIASLYVSGDITVAAANLCRGIASLFQYQSASDEVVESDATGDCIARYIAGMYSCCSRYPSRSLFFYDSHARNLKS